MTDRTTGMEAVSDHIDGMGFARNPHFDSVQAAQMRRHAAMPKLDDAAILAMLDRMSPEQAQATIDLAQGRLNKRQRDAMASRAVQALRGMGV